jgi:anti-sigma regulatory factor (Ser/Thr protein kinase)
VDFVDMAELGANPACIIPEWRRFLVDTRDAGPVRGVGEPVWQGRRDVELDEAELHEGLLNMAFDAGPSWRLMCPYDVRDLPGEIVAEALRNHPVVHPEPAAPDVGYAGHEHALRGFTTALPEPPAGAARLPFDRRGLALLRRALREAAAENGMSRHATEDLVLSAHELATNSVLHGGGAGLLSFWREPDALVVEVRDGGRIDDPLVGRGLLDLDSESGRGIWMANQLCDLVQVRSGETGTQVRLWSWL